VREMQNAKCFVMAEWVGDFKWNRRLAYLMFILMIKIIEFDMVLLMLQVGSHF